MTDQQKPWRSAIIYITSQLSICNVHANLKSMNQSSTSPVLLLLINKVLEVICSHIHMKLFIDCYDNQNIANSVLENAFMCKT